MMLFTSGTPRPRGVLLSHRSLVNTARLTMVTAEVEPGAVAVAALPSFHAAGCVVAHLGAASVGGTVVLIDVDASAVLAAVAAEGASVLTCEPTVLDGVLHAARRSDGPVPRLDTVLVGGPTAPGSTIDAVRETFGASVHRFYGRAELPVICLTRRSDPRGAPTATVGRPLPHIGARIVDPAGAEVVPLGVTGEICARSHDDLISYVDDPEATAAAVDTEGWLHTGDLGSMDERGAITLSGRVDA